MLPFKRYGVESLDEILHEGPQDPLLGTAPPLPVCLPVITTHHHAHD